MVLNLSLGVLYSIYDSCNKQTNKQTMMLVTQTTQCQVLNEHWYEIRCFPSSVLWSWPSGLWNHVVLSVDINMSEERATPEMLAAAYKTKRCHFSEEHKLSGGWWAQEAMKGNCCAVICVVSQRLLEGLKKASINLSQYGLSLGQILNLGLPVNGAWVLSTQLQYSFRRISIL